MQKLWTYTDKYLSLRRKRSGRKQHSAALTSRNRTWGKGIFPLHPSVFIAWHFSSVHVLFLEFAIRKTVKLASITKCSRLHGISPQTCERGTITSILQKENEVQREVTYPSSTTSVEPSVRTLNDCTILFLEIKDWERGGEKEVDGGRCSDRQMAPAGGWHSLYWI